MTSDSVFVWNVRGLNGRARRNVVRDLLTQERATLVCLQETKVSDVTKRLADDRHLTTSFCLLLTLMVGCFLRGALMLGQGRTSRSRCTL